MVVPDLETSTKFVNVMEVSGANVGESGRSVKLPEGKMMVCSSNCEDSNFDYTVAKVPEEKLMTCVNNCEDDTFDVADSPSGHDGVVASEGNNEVLNVDIIGNVDHDMGRVAEMESRDVTDSESLSSSSSSFGCTDDSGTGSGAVSSDVEVESQVGSSGFYRNRKKKLKPHWRRFIRPLMWRCKWAELQIRELHLQACKYDRELSECEKRKQSQLESCAVDDLGIKSVPFISENRSVKLMKRKKRKRVEETLDIASYTSAHSLFSFYVSRKPSADSVYMDDDHGNADGAPAESSPFGNDEYGSQANWASFEFEDGNTFECILRKIEEAQLQIRQMRVRMDTLVRELAGNFTYSSFAPGAVHTPNFVLPCMTNDKIPSESVFSPCQQTSEKMPESAVLSCGGLTPLPDMVGSSEKPQTGEKCENIGQEILNNQLVKEELIISKEAGDAHTAESLLVTEGKVGNDEPFPDPNPACKTQVNREQPTAKIRSFSKFISPRNKRKRAMRKARPGRWNRKSFG